MIFFAQIIFVKSSSRTVTEQVECNASNATPSDAFIIIAAK